MGLGKPQSLCAAVAEHSSALEADLARFYPGTDLVDLWRGRLTWRKLAQLIRWLPKDAALYQSMRLARPVKPSAASGDSLVLDDPLQAMQHGYLEDLTLAVLNSLEARNWADSDPEKRGPFLPTLPRGYKRVNTADRDDAAVAAYFAGIQPATD